MTVPARRHDLLPRTLGSLAAAGFDKPRLFVDQCDRTTEALYYDLGLECSFRWPGVRCFGNFILSLWELYLREPVCDRYVVFQDDIVCVRNLRAYLNTQRMDPSTYWNLHTFPLNQMLCPPGHRGWFKSNQKGLSATSLVFSRDALQILLSNRSNIVSRPTDLHRGWRAVDGGVCMAMRPEGWQELCHNPSLVQHIGEQSVMGNRPHPPSKSFPGEVDSW
jgi:hypothetical protein